MKESTVKKNYVFRGKILNVRCDDVALEDGTPCKREIVEHTGGAAMACVVDGSVVLVRQYRYAYGEETLEIPAGKLDAREDPLCAAIRELREETGLIAKNPRHLCTFYPSPGYTEEKIHVYLTTEVERGEQQLDEGEFLNVEYLPLADAVQRAKRGEIKDAKTLIALLHLQEK